MATIKTSNTNNLIAEIVYTLVGSEMNDEGSILSLGEETIRAARYTADRAQQEETTVTEHRDDWSVDGTNTLTRTATLLTETIKLPDDPDKPGTETEETVSKLSISQGQATGITYTEKEVENNDYPGASGSRTETETGSGTFSSFDIASGGNGSIVATKFSAKEDWSDAYIDWSSKGSMTMSFAGTSTWDEGSWEAASSIVVNNLVVKESEKWSEQSGMFSGTWDFNLSLASKTGFVVNDALPGFELSGVIDSLDYSEKYSYIHQGFATWTGNSAYVSPDSTWAGEEAFKTTSAITDAALEALQAAMNAMAQNPNGFNEAIGTLRQALLAGNDKIDVSGSGGGYIQAGAGNDTVTGGKLNDALYGEAGNDTLLGGDGNDTLEGGDGNDSLNGGAGNDSVYGGDGDDKLDGGAGDDRLYGGEGNDNMTGGDGNDEVYGNAGDDVLLGGKGHDFVHGGEGNDNLKGEDGNDYLVGAQGKDTLDGGNGNDEIHGDSTSTSNDGNDHSDNLSGGAGDDYMTGGYGNDTLDGGVGNDRLYGADDNDSLFGGAGNDTLNGGVGNDTLKGDAGNDVLHGGSGVDTLTGGAGKDSFSFSRADIGSSLEIDVITDFNVKEDWLYFNLTGSEGDWLDTTIGRGNVQVRSAGGTSESLDYEGLLAAANTAFASGTGMRIYIGEAAGRMSYAFADADGNGTADIAVQLVGISGSAVAQVVVAQAVESSYYDDDYYYG